MTDLHALPYRAKTQYTEAQIDREELPQPFSRLNPHMTSLCFDVALVLSRNFYVSANRGTMHM